MPSGFGRSYLSGAGAFSMADNSPVLYRTAVHAGLDLKGRRIGRVKDAALVPLVHPSRIDRFLVGGGDTWLTVRYDQIRSISLGHGIQLSDEQLIPYHDDEYMLRIGRDLLDQQIIDVTGRKVVRVNDVTMESSNDGERDTLTVLEVDIGVRSIFRRLLQGVAAAALDPPPAAAHSAQLHPLGVLQRRRARPAAPPAPEHLLRQAGRDAPGRPGRHRRRTRPGRTRSHLRDHRQRSGRRRPLRSRIPRCRPAFWSPWSRKRPPTSWKKWPPTKPPTSSPNWKRKPPKRSSKRWSRSPRPKSASCSNSKKTPPAA